MFLAFEKFVQSRYLYRRAEAGSTDERRKECGITSSIEAVARMARFIEVPIPM